MDEAKLTPDHDSAQIKLVQEISRLQCEILKLTLENSLLRTNVRMLEIIASIHKKVYGDG